MLSVDKVGTCRDLRSIHCLHSDCSNWYYVRGCDDSGLRLLVITMGEGSR